MSFPEGFRRALEIVMAHDGLVMCNMPGCGRRIGRHNFLHRTPATWAPGSHTPQSTAFTGSTNEVREEQNMAQGFTKAQANAIQRFNAITAAQDSKRFEMVELTKEGSEEVRFGLLLNDELVAIILSKDTPEDDYDVADLGSSDDQE